MFLRSNLDLLHSTFYLKSSLFKTVGHFKKRNQIVFCFDLSGFFRKKVENCWGFFSHQQLQASRWNFVVSLWGYKETYTMQHGFYSHFHVDIFWNVKSNCFFTRNYLKKVTFSSGLPILRYDSKNNQSNALNMMDKNR